MIATCDDVRDLGAGFVLGALGPAEAASVRDHLATCAEPHPEIAELGGVVPYLAASLDPVEPSAGLRARLLAAAAAEPRAGAAAEPRAAAAAEPRAAAAAEPRAAAPTPIAATEARRSTSTAVATPPSAPIPFPSATERTARAEQASRSRLGASGWLLRIAAVLVIGALGAWNVQLQSRLGSVEGDLTAARAYQDAVASVIAIAAQPGAQTAFMKAGERGAATGVAAVGADGTLVLTMRGLAPTTGAEVYEAWVIVGGAAPIPIGGFQVGAAGTGTFHGSTDQAQPGAMVALTLEPLPNPTAPTLPVLSGGSLATASG
ncbi:MAG: anti-sigma factor [Candidatus Limnocylindrales bacterium]